MPGEIGSVIRREHLNSPIVRMWLFGLITLIEMGVVAEIRTLWPDGAWRAQLAPKRVEKAEALAAERHRQGRPADLLDCLQFADKAHVLVSDPGQRAALGYKSVTAADQAIRDIESLRNNLAHAQDIVADDWVTIARLAENLAELIEHFPRAGTTTNRAPDSG